MHREWIAGMRRVAPSAPQRTLQSLGLLQVRPSLRRRLPLQLPQQLPASTCPRTHRRHSLLASLPCCFLRLGRTQAHFSRYCLYRRAFLFRQASLPDFFPASPLAFLLSSPLAFPLASPLASLLASLRAFPPASHLAFSLASRPHFP